MNLMFPIFSLLVFCKVSALLIHYDRFIVCFNIIIFPGYFIIHFWKNCYPVICLSNCLCSFSFKEKTCFELANIFDHYSILFFHLFVLSLLIKVFFEEPRLLDHSKVFSFSKLNQFILV